MVPLPPLNLVDALIDEVALEGLDGITLQALWLRLGQRLHSELPFPKAFILQVWSLCVRVRVFDFYELAAARRPLVIFDRYEFVDPDLGIILEPDDVPEDIYPHCPIHDQENEIKGSCSTYYARKNISQTVRDLSFDEVDKMYGNKLVIVACQATREHALIGEKVNPTLELNMMQYCFLERVGRSRYYGEVTQGKISLNALKEDPKSLFYYRKFLLRHKLITKQIHHQKSSGHSTNGSLLHLPRFYVERVPKVLFLAEQVIEILKSKPDYMAQYDEIKRKLQMENSIKKLFKTQFFQKVVKTDIRLPYRTLYPNAHPSEWQYKNNPAKEKIIKVAQLLTPDIDIAEVWNKDEIQEDDDPQEVDVSFHKYNIPFLRQANAIIESKKSEGVSQGGLAREMGLTKLQSRTLLRNLVKVNIVATYMDDIGRQRLMKFVSKKYEQGSKMSKQFYQEMNRIKELTQQLAVENNAGLKTKKPVAKKDEGVKSKGENTKVDCQKKVSVADEAKNMQPSTDKGPVASVEELSRTFNVVNRILRKYNLKHCVTKYKCSSSMFKCRTGKEEPEAVTEKAACASNNSEPETTVSMYNNVKTTLTVVKPLSTGKAVNEVFGFLEDVEKMSSEKNNVSNITYRLLRRANMIIESVQEHQVIDDTMKLMKMIHEEEDKEGYDVKIDKKSLIRLLQKLAKDNLVKNIKLTLSANNKEKQLTFICDPNIDISHAVIQSAVEQAKLKFCLLTSQKTKLITKKTIDGMQVEKESSERNECRRKNKDEPASSVSLSDKHVFKYDPKQAKKNGYCPKFLRMKVMHIFLYYLVYDHPGEQTLSKKGQIEALRNNGSAVPDELTEEREFSTIYSTSIDWKMFVPPLPKHNGWPSGWTLMCDVLLRMPLSTFLKIHYLPYFVQGLEKYVNHPIRKHYLVRNLPTDVRNPLLYGRKYIFNIHQTVTRLCYIGLAQFGPQRLKEKDQVFVYLNRRTELLDTTSSAPNYHIIEDKEYPVIKYTFDKMQIVEKYWYDMWNMCINTALGGRLVVQGKDILLEDLSKKASMLKTIEARTPEEAIKLDTGQVPGDRKGAAGIDSACFAHLKRNWNWGLDGPLSSTCPMALNRRRNEKKSNERDAYLSKIKAKPLKFTDFPGLRKVSGLSSMKSVEIKKKTQQNKTVDKTSHQKKYEAVAQANSKQKSFVRRVLPRKNRSRKRVQYDEVDYRALQRMHKLRVDWDPHEDKILLVCKVVMMYLFPNPRKQIVTFTAVRDVLREHSCTSYNKTSRACQRRLLYILRQQQTIDSVALGVEEMKQNYFLSQRFDGISEKLKAESRNSHEYEKRVIEVFQTLVAYVARKYYDISEIAPKQHLPLPQTLQEFNIFYKIVHPPKPFINRGFRKDVRTVNDIHSATINLVIHSSMCCAKDRRSWAYQLFKIYQQYPEILLRNAMAKIRADQMVTVKKNHMCMVKKYGNYMPMSSSQYQLSHNYIYKFHTRWPYSIFNESFEVLMKLIQSYTHRNDDQPCTGIEILPVTGGIITAIHDYISLQQLDLDIEIPDQIIMLDPRLKEKDETYFRIAKRYQDVLVSLDHLQLWNDPSPDRSAQLEQFNEFDNQTVKAKSDKDDNIFINFDEDKDALSQLGTTENVNFNAAEGRNVYDDLNSDEEICPNGIDEESNVIKFQDGTKIVLNKDDIEDSCVNQDSITESLNKKTSATNDNLPEAKRRRITVEESGEIAANVDKVHNSPSKIGDQTCNDSSHAISSTINAQKSDISTAKNTVKKRSREDNEKVIDSDEPAEKRTKTSDEDVDSLGKNNGEDNKRSQKENDHVLSSLSVLSQDESKDINDKINGEKEKDVASKGNTCSKEEERVNAEVALELTKEKQNNYTKVSDILYKLLPEKNILNPYCSIDEKSDLQKKYTRIALLRMREELNDLTAADSHHAHEYFAVNMFKIFYALEEPNSAGTNELQTFKGCTIPSKFVPLNFETSNEVIRNISRLAIFPKNEISYSDYKKHLPADLSLNLEDVDRIYKYIQDKKEIGASIHDLMNKFQSTLGKNLCRIVENLTENQLLLRSGVTAVRYIHQRYASPWVINSYKIYRLEKESLTPAPKGTIYLTNTSGNEDNNENIVELSIEELNSTAEKSFIEEHFEEPSTVNNETRADNSINTEKVEANNIKKADSSGKEEIDNLEKEKANNSQKAQVDDTEEDTRKERKKRMQRKRTRLVTQKDISTSAKQLDLTTAEEIRVVIKPWIRIDGVLNRRVLDRMLGAVLTYCLTHPGMTLSKLQNRFVPALQPIHTRELVQILVKLGCLESKLVQKPRVTLFSKPTPVKPRKMDNDWAAEEDLVFEPLPGAFLKFGLFLSTKMYSTDYIA